MKKIFSNRYFKFSVAFAAFLLFIIWIGNYWWLLLSPILFDLYVTKRVHWAFWKKKGVEKQPYLREWADAIIFAVVA
ncbi:MAG: hypothetical protein RIS47_203, partial [Bacteroidota bacterium]